MRSVNYFFILLIVLSPAIIGAMEQPQPPLLAERGLMQLPAEFQGKPVYYLHTPCIKGVSCGYYTLNNAIQLERRLKGELPISVDEFIGACTRGPQTNLLDGTHYEQRMGIAAKYKLGPITQFRKTTTGYDIETSPEAAKYWNITDLRVNFLGGRFDIVHVMGVLEVQQTPHVILLSVVRHADGTPGLYVFDNCNVDPAEYPIMYKYIESLLNSFIIPAMGYSPEIVSDAIKNGNITLLKYLLQKPEVISLIHDSKSTYLLNAFDIWNTNKFATLNLLLSHTIFIPHQVLNFAIEKGVSCIKDEGKEIIKLLLHAGADPFAQEQGPLGISLVQKLLKSSYATRREDACLKVLESYFTESQRQKFEELKKNYKPGFSIQKLIEQRQISPLYASRQRDLHLANKDINSLEGLQKFEYKDAYTSGYFNGNYITEIPKDSFKDFKNLKRLNFEGNQIKSIDSDAFSGLKSLEELNLTYNELTYLKPAVIKNILDAQAPLASLNISYNRLSKGNIDAIKAVLPPSVKFDFTNQREASKTKTVKKIESEKFIIPELETQEFE